MVLKIKEKENEPLVPWLADNEFNFLKSFLKKDTIAFEWGSGGSTIELSKYVKEYYSVEHDFKWYNLVLKNINKKVRLYYMPPNVANLKWFPVFKEGNYKDFKDYIETVDLIGSLGKKFDFVFIDGRARVDCALQALPYLSDKAVVFIHDCDRSYYWEVLKYYEIVDVVGRLIALKKKTDDTLVDKKDRGFLISKFLLSDE